MTKSPDAFRTISEVAEDLDLPQHVLRFWETRFAQIRPMKRGGGRRYYRPDDVELLRGIRQLLYGEGYTIRGVQRILKDEGPRFVLAAGRGEVTAVPKARPLLEPAEDAHEDVFSPDLEIERDDQEPDEDTPRFVGSTVHRPAHRPIEPAQPVGGARSEPGLRADDIRRLQATLAELLECKRLLDQAR